MAYHWWWLSVVAYDNQGLLASIDDDHDAGGGAGGGGDGADAGAYARAACTFILSLVFLKHRHAPKTAINLSGTQPAQSDPKKSSGENGQTNDPHSCRFSWYHH